MAKRLFAVLALAVGWSGGFVVDAAAQATTATISGTVVDETAAVVRGVAISLINAATGVQRTTATGPQGSFIVALLPPGVYRVTARHDGFTPSEIAGVTLNVGDTLELRLVLKVARLGAVVTVSAEPARVSMLAAVGTVVDRQFVANLPLNGRSFQSLIAMTPGVVLTPATSNSPGQFSVNGQRSDANYFMVDGVSANVGVQPTAGLGPSGAGAVPALTVQGGTNSLVSVDALQEFKIETSTYAAEFGRSPGAQVSIVTRSGTNEFHGALFEYFRDDALDSTDYFVTRQRLRKPEERQHDFGGVLGGPIQRNRTFMFLSYEGLRLEQPRSAVTEVPSLSSRFAASEPVKPLLAAFPLPSGPETGAGLAQFSASYADPSTLDVTSVRVDRTFGALNVFGRYNYAASEGSSRLGSFAAASVNTIGWVENHLQTLTTGATWIVSPMVSHELRVNWSRHRGTNFQTIDAFGGAVIPPATMLHPAFAPAESTYRVNLSAPNVFFDEGPNASNLQRQVNIVGALLLTKERHQVKLGIDYRRLLPVYGPTRYVQAYTFAGVAGVLNGTAASVLTAASSTSNRNSQATNFSAYAQDTWAPLERVTLTYGLRWEVNPAPGLSDSDEALTLSTADPASIGLAAPGTPMYRTTYDNFAPRLGAAYRVSETRGREMVVRGGWGVFFDLASAAVINNLSQTFPFTAQRSFSNVAFPAAPGMLAPPTVVPGSPADFLVAADPALKLPYTHQWNVAVEQALGASSAVSVSYVGALGRRLLSQERILNPTPQFQIVTVGTNRGHSRYDALQAKFTRRLANGLQSLVSYTLAQSKDNISNDTIPVLPLFRADPNQDWGPSAFDVRHTLSGGLTYALPAWSRGAVWRAITDGWSVDAVFIARSAPPVNVVTGTAPFAVSNALRPDVVPATPYYVDDAAVPGGRRLNRAAFASPPLDVSGNPQRQGTLSRNALRGFAMSQVDLAVHRDIPAGGSVKMQLRAEAFNLFNQVNLAPPINALSSGLFGQATRSLASSFGGGGITGGGLSPLYQVGGPRSIQVACRVQF